MRPSAVVLTTAVFMTATALMTAPALAQGSAGGTIGKQGKSISGGDDAPPPARRPNQDQPRASTSAASIAGNWDWEGSCASGAWTGGMVFRATSATQFTGEFTKGHIGGLAGTVQGNRVSFVRDMFGIIKQQWTGTLSGSPGGKLRMQGPFTTPERGGCRFSATKG